MKTDLNIYESLIIRQYLRWEPVYPVKKRILEIQSNPGSRDRVTGGWDTCQGGIGAIQLFRRHSKPQKLHRERYDRSLTIFPDCVSQDLTTAGSIQLGQVYGQIIQMENWFTRKKFWFLVAKRFPGPLLGRVGLIWCRYKTHSHL